MRVRVLQHVPFEGLAALEPALRAGDHEVATTRFFASDPLPTPDAFDWLVVLGGPMSVHDEARYAWLAPEKELVHRSIERGCAVLGICLGAQLVAEVLGGRVRANREKEIGWFPVERMPGAEASSFGRALAPRTVAFHWHGETFELPPGAIHLARSEACENQAFGWGERVLALQFHLETTPAAAASLVEHCRDELLPGRFVEPPEAMLSDPSRFERIRPVLARLLGVFERDAPSAGPRLATERLALRPLVGADLDALHALFTDPQVRRFLWDDRVIERSVAAEVIEASAARFAEAGVGAWVIEPRGGGELLGFAALRRIDGAGEIELLYGLAPAHWGKGYAVEASRAVLAHGFDGVGLERIAGRVDSPNRASVRVLERLGMRFEGESAVAGRPTLHYAITRAEFAAGKSA
jgi:GMP synthase-like glutamine amidotransferase/RimJ/RimL family protein N-acetyltransferase